MALQICSSVMAPCSSRASRIPCLTVVSWGLSTDAAASQLVSGSVALATGSSTQPLPLQDRHPEPQQKRQSSLMPWPA